MKSLVLSFLVIMSCIADVRAGEALRSLETAEMLGVSPHEFDPASLNGKPVIVTFFASWCPPCNEEFKEIAKVQRDAPQLGLQVVAVNAFENWGGQADPERMQRFLDRTTPDFPLIEGSQQVLAAFGPVNRIPMVVVFDSQGRETWRFVHARGASKTFATAEDILQALK